MDILEKISDAKLKTQLQGHNPTHVVMSQSDYDELWQCIIGMISEIEWEYRGKDYAIGKLPKFNQMYDGLIPVVASVPMEYPRAVEMKIEPGDSINISDILEGEANGKVD